MNAVEPIRDREKVQDIADYLKSKNERDYVLWMFGIYTALRVSDILKMRVRDVKNKDYIIMREQKTNNERKFVINKKLRKAIDHYIKDKPDYELLFKSRQGQEKAISRQQAYNIIKEAAAITDDTIPLLGCFLSVNCILLRLPIRIFIFLCLSFFSLRGIFSYKNRT